MGPESPSKNESSAKPYSEYLVTMITSIALLTYISIIIATILHKWIIGSRPMVFIDSDKTMAELGGSYQYILSFVTASKSNKNMTARIFFQINGELKTSKTFNVDSKNLNKHDYQDAFDPSSIDFFLVDVEEDLKEINSLEIFLEEPKLKSAWFLDYVMINDVQRNLFYYLPVHRWLRASEYNKTKKLTISSKRVRYCRLLSDNIRVCFRECFIWTCRLTTRHMDLPLDSLSNVNQCYFLFTCLVVMLLIYVSIYQTNIILYSNNYFTALCIVVFLATVLSTVHQLFYRFSTIELLGIIKNFHLVKYSSRKETLSNNSNSGGESFVINGVKETNKNYSNKDYKNLKILKKYATDVVNEIKSSDKEYKKREKVEDEVNEKTFYDEKDAKELEEDIEKSLIDKKFINKQKNNSKKHNYAKKTKNSSFFRKLLVKMKFQFYIKVLSKKEFFLKVLAVVFQQHVVKEKTINHNNLPNLSNSSSVNQNDDYNLFESVSITSEIEICPRDFRRYLIFTIGTVVTFLLEVLILASGDYFLKGSVYIWMISLLLCFLLQIFVAEPLKVLFIAFLWTFYYRKLFI